MVWHQNFIPKWAPGYPKLQDIIRIITAVWDILALPILVCKTTRLSVARSLALKRAFAKILRHLDLSGQSIHEKVYQKNMDQCPKLRSYVWGIMIHLPGVQGEVLAVQFNATCSMWAMVCDQKKRLYCHAVPWTNQANKRVTYSNIKTTRPGVCEKVQLPFFGASVRFRCLAFLISPLS